MTVVAEHAEAESASGGLRRRWIVATFIAVAIAAGGLITAGVLRHLDHQYGPLQPGPFGGVYADRGWAFSKDGSSYHLADQPGATAKLLASVENVGAHSVKITGIDTDSIVSGIRWSVFHAVNGGSVTGVATPWRTFPAIVPAHGIIRLLLTIHRPSNCDAYPTIRGVSTASWDGYEQVHWDSLLHAHASQVQVYQTADGVGLHVC